eukprot:4803552-Prymnesium_polylepis.2
MPEAAVVAKEQLGLWVAHGALPPERLVEDPLRAPVGRAPLAVDEADVHIVARRSVVERVDEVVARERRRR